MYSDIYAAIEARVFTVLDPEAVLLPNNLLDISNRVWWARITHLPLTPTVATIGVGGLNQRDGITQVDIFTRPGTGRTSMPDEVVALFTRDIQFNLADGTVYEVIAYHEGGDLIQDGHWQERVIIRWSSLASF